MNKFLKAILPDGIIGISLAPFGVYIDPKYDSPELRRHESIHWHQQIEMLIVFFYLWYFIEWLMRLVSGSLVEISFEQEAYRFDTCPDYVEHRRPFTWIWFVLW